MHGEARHLRRMRSSRVRCGVGETFTIVNGEMVRLSPGAARLIDEAPVGRLFRDGNLIVPDAEGPVKARRKLSFAGIAVVALVLSRRGEILASPVVLDGIPAVDCDGESMNDIVLDAIDGTLRSIPPKRRGDPEWCEEAVYGSVRAPSTMPGARSRSSRC